MVTSTQRPTPYQIGSGAGAVLFNGFEVPITLVRQAPPAWAAGFPVDRTTRENVFPLVFDDLSGGFLPSSGFFGPSMKTRVSYNEGIMVHQPRLATLAYKTTSVTDLDNIDISGFRAANKRVHTLMSTLGVSGQRYLAAIGTKVYRDTSTTDPTLALADDSLTDSVLSVANLKLNATDYTALSTDGTTNDTRGATDVTGATPWSGGTELITHANAADGFFFMDYFGSLRWNVFGGVLNNVNGLYCYSDAPVTLPLTVSTLLPVVYKDTKDIAGTIATVATGAKSPASAGNHGRGDVGPQSTFDSSAGVIEDNPNPGIWINPANLASDDGAYATYTYRPYLATSGTETASGGITSYLQAGNYDFSAIPRAAKPVGITVVINAKESATGANAYLSDARLTLGGNPAGEPRSTGGELATTDGDFTLGSTSDTWGLPDSVTGADLQRIGVQVRFAFDSGNAVADTDYTISGDSITIDITYRMPGTQISLPKGGFSPGKPPHRANRIAYCHPVSDEEATVFKPRIITYTDFETDGDGNRLLGTTSQPPTQLGNVDSCNWYQGALAMAGGPAPGVGSAVKLCDDEGVTRDLGFPAVHGTAAVRVAGMFAIGTVLMVYTCHADSTNAQLWMYYAGKWNAYGALFSKALGGAMSTTPLGWAEATPGSYQNVFYCFYPSSTNTAYTRQFVPSDPLNADPFLVNTSQVKQDGPLYVQTAELEVLPSESNAAIMCFQAQSRRIDDNTAYGSVIFTANITGDHAFATQAWTNTVGTFDAAAETFTDRNIFSAAGDPGVSFSTAIFRFTLNHQTGTSESPNALPMVVFIVAEHAPLEAFEIHLANEQPEDPVAMAKRLRALMNSKVSQRFLGAGRDIPVKFSYEFGVKQGSMGTASFGWKDLSKAVIRVQQTPGGTTA